MPRVTRCCCKCGGEDRTVSPLTLRFRNKPMEAGFLAQRKAPLLRSCKSLLPIPLVFYALGVAMNFMMSKHLRSSFPTDAAYRSQQVEIASDITMCVSTAIFLALLRCERLVARVGTFAIELGLTILLTLIMSTLALSAPQTVSRLLGQDMVETYGEGWYGSDSSLVLKIDILVTGAHLGPKVRWHLLVPMAVLAVLLYAANAFVIGSAESMGDRAYNMLLLTCLILTASVAKRVAERGERQAFRDIIQEKSLRCEAEFQLSQSQSERGSGDAPEPPLAAAETSSVPATAVSAHVFDPLYQDDVDPTAQLARIAEMGNSEHWLIDESEVKLLEDDVLGAGSYGVVSRAVFCGLLVAVKSPQWRLDKESMQRLPGFCNELRVLRHLRHPNIVATLGAIIDPQALKVAIVLELVKGVTLDNFVMATERLGGPSPSTLARYQVMLGVCRALVYMHTRRPQLVHGDLKSANIIVDTQDGAAHPKLLDFGLSRIIAKGSRPLGGSLAWMAPEVFCRSGPVRCSADVYSFGRLLAFVATGIEPLWGLNPKQAKKALRSNAPPLPAWPADCVFKPHLKQPVRSCISADPSQRPSILDIHGHLLSLLQDLDLGSEGGVFLEAVRKIRAHAGPPPAEQRGDPQSPMDAIATGMDVDRLAVLPEASSSVPHGEPQEGELGPEAEGYAVQTGTGTPKPEVLLHPGKLPTDPGAMALSLLDMATNWNYKVAEEPCCQLHASARMAQQLVNVLLARPCFMQALVIPGGQCVSCGMLGLEGNVPVCDFCGTGPPMTSVDQAGTSRLQL